MITVNDRIYILTTKNTQYMLRISPEGHPEHLHYGGVIVPEQSLRDADVVGEAVKALQDKKCAPGGTATIYTEKEPNYCMEDMLLEISGVGKGDYRQPMLELRNYEGVTTTDFVFKEAVVLEGTVEIASKLDGVATEELPGAYAPEESGVQTLVITLDDSYTHTSMRIYYTVFPECDVITRKVLFMNTSDKIVHLTRMMSVQLDLPGTGYRFTTFNGNWAREMNRNDTVVTSGMHVNQSVTGVSSNRANPFVMISNPETSEESGDCIGINLIYSGNHMESLEVGGYENTRFLAGIHTQNFDFLLSPGSRFATPEAVLSYSAGGFRRLSENLHFFVRNHVVRGEWKFKDRPILLNSWEASYFNITEKGLLKLAGAAQKAGIELFVMDDGWFGERNSDSTSLGDWTVNKKKLPHGLKGLSDRIHAMGLMFGIWVEPEMVSEESGLYKAHPDWAMRIQGEDQSLGRHQMILDLANPDVQDYLIESVSDVLKSARIEYVKWDMNRMVSSAFSPYLAGNRQGETLHSYYLGLYRVMRELTEAFPKVLFEGCASGGNRFDLGILSYFPQIWASDNSDAVSRLAIQEGYSYGYPQSVYTAHVSNCPNHQTTRVTPLETRFHVASFGLLGYEFNLPELSKEQQKSVAAQVATYKKYRHTLQYGQFYRKPAQGCPIRSTSMAVGAGGIPVTSTEGNVSWSVVSGDRRQAVDMEFALLQKSNEGGRYLQVPDLQPEGMYHLHHEVRPVNVTVFGDLINMVAPIHIRQGSLLHRLLCRFYHMPGEND